ncbi:MAG: hypothetical protein R3E95_22570 [Thiolinea sp.]
MFLKKLMIPFACRKAMLTACLLVLLSDVSIATATEATVRVNGRDVIYSSFGAGIPIVPASWCGL